MYIILLWIRLWHDERNQIGHADFLQWKASSNVMFNTTNITAITTAAIKENWNNTTFTKKIAWTKTLGQQQQYKCVQKTWLILEQQNKVLVTNNSNKDNIKYNNYFFLIHLTTAKSIWAYLFNSFFSSIIFNFSFVIRPLLVSIK